MRASSTATSTKRSGSTSVSAKASPKSPPPSATNTAAGKTAAAKSSTSAASPRGRSTASTTKRAASPAGKKAGSKKRAASTSAASPVGDDNAADVSIASGASASGTTKAKKAAPVGNFYLPAHNLSFASNPLGNKSSKNAKLVPQAAGASESGVRMDSGASPYSPADTEATAGSPAFSPADFSFSDPATIFAMSPSRAAATYEKERVHYESRAASPVRAASPTSKAAAAAEVDEDAPDVLAHTSPSMPNNAIGGDEEDAVAAAEAEAVDDEHVAPPTLAVAPKFKSYFFGHPKPAVPAVVVEASASHASETLLASGAAPAEQPNAAAAEPNAANNGNGVELEGLSREGSPAPAAPATKIVSFDAALAIGAANQTAYDARQPPAGEASPGSYGSPSAYSYGSPSSAYSYGTSSYGSPSSSAAASPSRKKKAGSKSKSRASSAGGKKSKKGSKKAKEPIDPEDCRPPGPIERLFGDVAKSGMTGAPTLASLAIAAVRTGSEVDLKAAARADAIENTATAVTPLQTANALFNLGWMHYHGLGGCGINYKKSYAYFYDAATKFDHPMAYYYLALQLRDGKGVEKNLLAAHDGFQTSLALAGGGGNVAPAPEPRAVAEANKAAVAEAEAEGSAEVAPIRLVDEGDAAAPYKALVMPPEFTHNTNTNGDNTDEASAPAAVVILNQANKHKQSRLNKAVAANAPAGGSLEFEGIEPADVATAVSWQVGKLWAAGAVVVLEEVAGPSSSSAASPSPIADASVSMAGPSRAASPQPATPRGSPSARGASIAKASMSAASPAGTKKAAGSSTTKKGTTSKGKTATKKAAALKKDPTNNTGGGPNVVIKRLIAAAEGDAAAAGPSPAEEASAAPAEGAAAEHPAEKEKKGGKKSKKGHSTSASAASPSSAPAYVSLQFRKVRYAVDKPVAMALFERCAAAGFEHAALYVDILRDDPIPRAELGE